MFYNCYFSSYVASFAPVWILTDKNPEQLSRKSKRKGWGTVRSMEGSQWEDSCMSMNQSSLESSHWGSSMENSELMGCEETKSASTIGSQSEQVLESLREEEGSEERVEKEGEEERMVRMRKEFITVATLMLHDFGGTDDQEERSEL